MDKQEFMDLLRLANINKREFAKIANIPYGTVNNWGLNRKSGVLKIPNWVEPFIHYYIKAKKLDYVTGEICNKLQEAK